MYAKKRKKRERERERERALIDVTPSAAALSAVWG